MRKRNQKGILGKPKHSDKPKARFADPPASSKDEPDKKEKDDKKETRSAPLRDRIGKYKIIRTVNECEDTGTIYQVSLDKLKLDMVMRVLPVNDDTRSYVEHAMMDVRVISSIRHPFISRFVDCFVIPKSEDSPNLFW